jgi:hypothetical protein
MRQLGPQFLMIDLVGRVEDEAVPIVEEALRQVAPIPGLVMYWDASGLESFSNSFRATCTDYILANRKTIGEIATLSQSALIAMAISATNLALGGILNSYRDRDKFFAAQRAAAEKQGLEPDKLAG